jgi:hypothetical protein
MLIKLWLLVWATLPMAYSLCDCKFNRNKGQYIMYCKTDIIPTLECKGRQMSEVVLEDMTACVDWAQPKLEPIRTIWVRGTGTQAACGCAVGGKIVHGCPAAPQLAIEAAPERLAIEAAPPEPSARKVVDEGPRPLQQQPRVLPSAPPLPPFEHPRQLRPLPMPPEGHRIAMDAATKGPNALSRVANSGESKYV